MTASTERDPSLAAMFAAPPSAPRILKIIHSAPDAPDEQDALLRLLASQGFGGVVTNVSFSEYLESEANWSAFTRFVSAARGAGMVLWLYDERGYPSGTAGGITMREHPEWEARGLLIAEADSSGGAVQLEVPPDDLLLAAAFPVVDGAIDLSRRVDIAAPPEGGTLSWDAPAGAWRVLAIGDSPLYEGTHAALSLADKLAYIDLMCPEATARFLEVTHAAYAQRLGADLGRWFVATFTDEPSLMGMFLKRQPYRVLPWTPRMLAEFQSRRGYALEALLPALVTPAGARTSKVRYDFWTTVAELTSENFFGQIQTWCRAHNIPSGGHLLMEESLLTHVPLYGDFFRCARRLDAPSIDCLTSVPASVPWFIARLIGSVAELEGRSVTMCETSDHAQRYRPAGDTRPIVHVTEAEIRGTCNRLMLNGITTITSYYSFADLDTGQLVRLNEWVGRCCTMLRGGHQVADTALLYPIESVWPRFEPSHNWVEESSPEAHRIESIQRAAAEQLYWARRDFTCVDARALIEARARGDALVHGALEWRAVVLPCADTLPLRAWENLLAFWRGGGVLVALSVLPANSEDEFPSARVQEIAAEIFGPGAGARTNLSAAGGAGIFLPQGAEALLPAALDAVLEPQVRLDDKDAPLRITHRRIDSHDVYFAINDSADVWEGAFGLNGAGAGERWDPATGAVSPVDAAGISVRFEPYGGAFFRFDDAAKPKRLTPPINACPLVTRTALPAAAPTLAKGEFVDATLTAAPVAEDGRSLWKTDAVLTRGQVDTFLFVSFDYPNGIDLRAGAFLAVETWTPQGQRTPTPLRIILRDARGAEYLANTDRQLGGAAHGLSFVPMTQFEWAGWNALPNAPLDLSAVTSIRIGWGGYLGAEGEKIAFTFAAPELGSVRP